MRQYFAADKTDSRACVLKFIINILNIITLDQAIIIQTGNNIARGFGYSLVKGMGSTLSGFKAIFKLSTEERKKDLTTRLVWSWELLSITMTSKFNFGSVICCCRQCRVSLSESARLYVGTRTLILTFSPEGSLNISISLYPTLLVAAHNLRFYKSLAGDIIRSQPMMTVIG